MSHTTSRNQIHTPIPALEIREHRDLFRTGRWTTTPAAIAVLAHHHVDPAEITWRHRTSDWGDVELDEAMANNDAVQSGGPIRSAYWIGTEVVYIETIAGGGVTAIAASPED